MAKAKYNFNPDTLSYDKVELNFKTKLHRFLVLLSSSLLMGIIITVVFLQFYETPKMRTLKRENRQLLTQYELLSKNLENVEKVMNDIQQRDDNLYRVIFEADPIPNSIRKAGFGGINKYAHLENLNNSELVINTSKKLDVISKAAYIQSKSYDEVLKLALNKEKMLSCIPAVMPVSKKDLTYLSSPMGFRIHPIYKIRKYHEGQDFVAPTGTKIYSTGDGVVEGIYGSTKSKVSFGLWLVINHGYGYKTLYGHLKKANVKKGQKIKRGDVIAFVGNSGGSVGPHLHYEVHKDNKVVDPRFYFFKDITPTEYEEMIASSSNIGQALD